MNVVVKVSRRKTMRVAAVLMLAVMVAVPVTSAYLNENIDMTRHVEDQSCYCHGPLPVPEVEILIDVPTQVAFTPNNRSVEVSIGVLGTPENLTGFGLFLNATEDSSGVRWTKRFSNGTIDVGDGTVQGIIRVNGTSMWTVGEMTSSWFNVSFIPGQIDQDINLQVVGMKADGNGNETGDYWNMGQVTIEVKMQRLVFLSVGVSNLERISVNEVLVDFYIDGEYIGNDTVPFVPGSESENASIEWDATFEKEGKHRLRAVIDPMGDITEVDKSNNEVTQDIWLGGPPEEEDLTMYYGLASMAVGAAIIALVFWVWRRRQYRF